MIRCNLAVLLAERKLKISKVFNDTGLSRTTLTSLVNNHGVGAQLGTINTLCLYLRVTPEQLLTYAPVDIKVDSVKMHPEDNSISALLEVNITIKDEQGEKGASLSGNCISHINGGMLESLYISIALLDEDGDPDIEANNSRIISAFQKLSAPFLHDIEAELIEGVISAIKAEHDRHLSEEDAAEGYGFGEGPTMHPSVTWDKALYPREKA